MRRVLISNTKRLSKKCRRTRLPSASKMGLTSQILSDSCKLVRGIGRSPPLDIRSHCSPSPSGRLVPLDRQMTLKTKNIWKPAPQMKALADIDTKNLVWGQQLASGDHCQVFLGLDSTTGCLYAVRRFDWTRLASRLRFSVIQTAVALPRLLHSGILQYSAPQIVENELRVCSEYVATGTLRSLLDRVSALPVTVAARYTADILSGLIYLQKTGFKGVTVTSNTVLVDGSAKLDPFECLAFKSVFNSPNPVWNIGCLLVEMLTGAAVLQVPDSVPEEVRHFLGKCFEPNPRTLQELACHPFLCI